MKRKRIANFIYSSQDNFDSQLTVGTELTLSLSSHNWSSTGVVIKISASEEVSLELKNQDPPPTNIVTGYKVELVWKSTSYKRMENGLKKFWKD